MPRQQKVVPLQADLYREAAKAASCSVWIASSFNRKCGPWNAENPKGNRWAQYVSRTATSSWQRTHIINYLKPIQYFLEIIGLIDVDIHIYLDNDIDKSVIKRIKKIISPLKISIVLHLNIMNEEKDFGVPINRIKDYSYRLI